MYANPHNSGCAVNMLDAVVLGATEVDVNFNVNVNTEFNGDLLHGIGGHQDTAAGAGITIVTLPLIRGRIPSVVKDVITVTSPGETIDVIITDRGTAINPAREDLLLAAKRAGISLCSIQELCDKAQKLCGKPQKLYFTDNIIGLIEYRDGTVIDVVRQVEDNG
jgi:citrate lyase subunit alpha/citrate CoA-transferase